LYVCNLKFTFSLIIILIIMQFRTIVDIPSPSFRISPFEKMLFVGSCFADRIGRRFLQEQFRVTVNPYGVMYNPASVYHSLTRCFSEEERDFRVVFITLGTNRVYVLKETGEIVDNCQKRPQRLFLEQQLSVGQCAAYLRRCIHLVVSHCPQAKVVITVSPIRYAKYGFHGSALSKAVLLLAAQQVQDEMAETVGYFPAYEIVNDELRDYRFYQPDMLHPSDQAVEYIWERLVETYFSEEARRFLDEWRPVKEALAHRPFHPDSEAYRSFLESTRLKAMALKEKYPLLQIDI
jgi:hypothetical protein